MKKVLILLLLSCTLLTGCSLGKNEDENKQAVQELLSGFYENEYGKYEIYYGESIEDKKDVYLEATKELYEDEKYIEILEYNVQNDISIVKNNY